MHQRRTGCRLHAPRQAGGLVLHDVIVLMAWVAVHLPWQQAQTAGDGCERSQRQLQAQGHSAHRTCFNSWAEVGNTTIHPSLQHMADHAAGQPTLIFQLMHITQALLPGQEMHGAGVLDTQLQGACAGHHMAQQIGKPVPHRLLSQSHLQRHLAVAILLQSTAALASVTSAETRRYLRGRRRREWKALVPDKGSCKKPCQTPALVLGTSKAPSIVFCSWRWH